MSNKEIEEELEKDFYEEFGHFHAPCNKEGVTKSEIDDWEFVSFFQSFISQIRQNDCEEVNKIFCRIKIGFDSRIATKYLKPESKGYNKCVYKLNVKVNQAKEQLKDYFNK